MLDAHIIDKLRRQREERERRRYDERPFLEIPKPGPYYINPVREDKDEDRNRIIVIDL